METELEIPALSRPFTLGMLYDARLDKLIPGISLWSVKKLEDIRKNQKTEKTSIEIIASDSISAKSLAIKASAEVKASLLAGLIELSGSGEFLNDNKTSVNTTRVSLKYSLSERFEQLDMKHLASSGIEFPEGFNANSATHVVIAIEFGLDAYFIFEMNKDEEKNLTSAGGSLKTEVTKLSALLPVEGGAKASVTTTSKKLNVNIACKYYGDFSLGDSNPVTFEDAIKVYVNLPQIAKSASKVPRRVWLYPLSSLNGKAAKIMQPISAKLIESIENQFQGFINSRAKAQSLLEDKVIECFAHLKKDLEKYIQTIDRFDLVFKEYLCKILPQIRGTGRGEAELSSILQVLMLSPLGQNRDEFLEKVQKESLLLKTYLDKLQKSGIVVDTDIVPWETYLTEGVEKVICLSIDPFPRGDFISNLTDFVNSFPNSKTYYSSNYMWFEKENIRSSSMNGLNIFLTFLNINKSSKTLKFIAQFSSRQHAYNESLTNVESILSVWCYEEGYKQNIIIPTKPQKLFIDPNSVTTTDLLLSWKKSPPNATVSKFTINIFSKSDRFKKQCETTSGDQCQIRVSQLKAGEMYQFSVQANCVGGLSEESDKTEEISTGEEERLAIKVRSSAHRINPIRNFKTTIYKPLMKLKYDKTVKLSDGSNGGYRKYEIGDPPKVCSSRRAILLVGASGSGKTTFLNSLANYIFDVRAEDDFRFKIVTASDEMEEKRMSRNPISNVITQFVSAYCFCSSRLSYQLTIVDTPGFSDTPGSQMNKDTTNFIKLLFETAGENGIDQLNAVCLVVKNSDTKITPGDKNQIDSVISLFGNDMQDNIIPIITFSDASDPPVLKALKDANINFKENLWFPFNNSAVFEGNKMTPFQKNFWILGDSSFSSFLERIETILPKSLALQKKVLRKRAELENHVLTIQRKIDEELNALDVMKQEAEVIKSHRSDIELRKDYTYTITEVYLVPESIEGKSINTTTCTTCNFTCHNNCEYADDNSKNKCVAMENGVCKECPKRCSWKMHKNLPILYVKKERVVTKTNKEIENQYNAIKKDEASKENRHLENLVQQFTQKQKFILTMISEIKKCLNELQKIALLQSNITEIDYLEYLILSEKSRRTIGWDKRIELLDLDLKLAQQVNIMSDPNYDPSNINSEAFKKIVQLFESQPLLIKRTLNEKIDNCKVQ